MQYKFTELDTELEELELASPLKRLVAFLIDAAILGIPVFIFIAMIFTLMVDDFFDDQNISDTAIWGFMVSYFMFIIFIACAPVLYYTIMESSARQATFGKQIMGIYVVTENGEKMSFWLALGRNFSKYLSTMIMYIGYIMILFTENRQGLHDLICNTLVVNGKPTKPN